MRPVRVTAEPELGTDFYIVPGTGAEQLEGLDDFPPGCWVDPSGRSRPSSSRIGR